MLTNVVFYDNIILVVNETFGSDAMYRKTFCTLTAVAAVSCGIFFGSCGKMEYHSERRIILISSSVSSEPYVSENSDKDIAVLTENIQESSDRQAAVVSSNVKINTVYCTKTGKRYHISESCAGKNAQEISLDEAIDKGLTPCKKCVE